MFNIFKRKPLLSDEDLQFQIKTFEWLLSNFGGYEFYLNTALILPTSEFFPSEVSDEDELALETFLMVKQHAGLSNWECELIAQEDDSNARVAPTISIVNAPFSPNGTFHASANNKVTISYNPALVSHPTNLVATFAHELAHYLTSTAKDEPPGGWENWEFATDIAATFLGFGIFMANSAFTFIQFKDVDSQGWQSNRSGYLSENEHAFALAIFCELKDLPSEHVTRHLKPHLQKLFKKARKEVVSLDIVDQLINIKNQG